MLEQPAVELFLGFGMKVFTGIGMYARRCAEPEDILGWRLGCAPAHGGKAVGGGGLETL